MVSSPTAPPMRVPAARYSRHLFVSSGGVGLAQQRKLWKPHDCLFSLCATRPRLLCVMAAVKENRHGNALVVVLLQQLPLWPPLIYACVFSSAKAGWAEEIVPRGSECESVDANYLAILCRQDNTFNSSFLRLVRCELSRLATTFGHPNHSLCAISSIQVPY